jgi:hypothetical protein
MSAIHADHYPVEHWLFGISFTPADGKPPLIILRDTSEPVFHGLVPERAIGLSLFRFEGVTLGSIPEMSHSAALCAGGDRSPRACPVHGVFCREPGVCRSAP